LQMFLDGDELKWFKMLKYYNPIREPHPAPAMRVLRPVQQQGIR
jgi:hypothetical protein